MKEGKEGKFCLCTFTLLAGNCILSIDIRAGFPAISLKIDFYDINWVK